MRALHRIALFAAASIAAFCSASAYAQQDFPNKPVRVIVPYSVGGSTDTLARLLGQKLSAVWGQPVIVENRPGGSTVIGADMLAKSPPDGYTIMLLSVDHVITPHLIPTPYHPIKDFAGIAGLSIGGLALVLNPAVPADSLSSFIKYAKSKPGELNYGSPAAGGIQHLSGEIFSAQAGLKMVHVPYKGGGPLVTDLVGGQIQAYFTPPVTVVNHIAAGRLKAVAITGTQRATALPQVPTFQEAGMAGLDVRTWFGLAGPAATPPAIIEKISADVARILQTADMKERISVMGMEPFITTQAQFNTFLASEAEKFSRFIRDANIKLDK